MSYKEMLVNAIVFLARAILMVFGFICAISYLIGFGLNIYINHAIIDSGLPETNPDWELEANLYSMLGFLACCYLLIEALFVILVAARPEERAVKLAATVSAATFAVCFLLALLTAPRWSRISDDVMDKLLDYQKQYDWSHESLRGEVFTNRSGATITWDLLQANFHCCGLRSGDEWALTAPHNLNRLAKVPASCCADFNSAGTSSGNNPTCGSQYANGCASDIRSLISFLLNLVDMAIHGNLIFASLLFMLHIVLFKPETLSFYAPLDDDHRRASQHQKSAA